MSTTLDTIIGRYTGRQRDALLPVLWDIQTAFGTISPEAVNAIAHTLRVPQAEIYGVIAFYSLFTDTPTARRTIRICTSPSCLIAGAEDVIDALHEATAHDDGIAVEHTTCLGLCEHAPAALVSERGHAERQIAPVDAGSALAGSNAPVAAVIDSAPQIMFNGQNRARAESLDEYGDYAALRRAIDNLAPETVIAMVEESGLVGRGGAAFPTGMKWRFTRGAPGVPHYMICNADESEPGTFKDRVVMDVRPHLLLEGMALAAYAVGAEQGYIFVRGEYPQSEARLRAAIAEAEAAGFLGARIMGSDVSFHIEVRRGAGAYICGEETALFEAIEGKRGFPRVKPPYPTTHGLFGKPTAVNNVETLAQVPGIIQHGADWFRRWGTEKSAGIKLVCASGHIQRPGVYEIPLGVTLRDLLEHQGGGVIGDLQAVLLGGAAGTFLTPDEIDVPLTFEDLRAAGSTLGSGAIMVFNDTVDLRAVLHSLAEFFQHESCGKCYPCQLGTQRQREIIARGATSLPGDRHRLRDVGVTMTESSLCGLGQTAALAVLSALDRWPELFNAPDQGNA